jgi:hypothetical protein
MLFPIKIIPNYYNVDCNIPEIINKYRQPIPIFPIDCIDTNRTNQLESK